MCGLLVIEVKTALAKPNPAATARQSGTKLAQKVPRPLEHHLCAIAIVVVTTMPANSPTLLWGGANIAEVLQAAVTDWGLIVTGNAGSMEVAVCRAALKPHARPVESGSLLCSG